jgi:TonB-dependent SusC/RagA subfamily outer membrane receptor
MKFSLFNIFIIILPFCFQVMTAQEASDNDLADTVRHNAISSDKGDFLTGYSNRRAADMTGSVSFVQNHQLLTITAGNVINQMQGLVPGLTIIGSGQPGETSKSFIRGLGSFSASTPLFIIDGVPVDDIAFLNPMDIEAVAVLKDASYAAIYGGRALNGVIVISTRKADNGFHIRYNTSMGFQFPGKGTADELLSSQELADLQWLVYKNDNRTETHPLYGPSTNPKPVLPSWAANTDWYDAITDLALIQNHDLSISGGTKNAKIYLGVGYLDQNGIILNTDTKRYSARLNSEFSFFKKHFKIGENLQVANRSGRYVPNLNESSPILTGPYRSQSILPVYISEPVTGLMHDFIPGEYGGTGMAARTGNSSNAVADRIRNKDDRKTDQQLFGNAYADILILKGLKWRTSFGKTLGETESVDYTLSTYENIENLISSHYTETYGNQNSWILTSFLNFERKSGNHSYNLLAGKEWIREHMGKSETTTRSGEVPGSGLVSGHSGYTYLPREIAGTFLNVDYSFKLKYFINISFRSDEANSENVNKVRYYYPAVSAGWRISKESFMQSVTWLNDFKLRASYGKTGNIYTGKDNAITTDAGFNSTLFNGHLGFDLDWFSRKSSDLFMILGLPGTAGDFPARVNIGKITNSGIDGSLNFNQSSGNIKFNADLYFSRYRNEIGGDKSFMFDQTGTRIGGPVRNQQGHPISSFFGYQVSGLFGSQAEINGAPLQDGAQPGFFRYVNQNGDAVITPEDRTFLGNANPDFTAGINLGLSYKKFDLGVLLYWVQGNEIFNFTRWWTDFWPSYNGQKSKRLLYESWTENNKNASVPKASSISNFSNNTQITSYFVEDGSYFRMKSLQAGYSFDEKILHKARISSLRVYLQAINLFTITNYSGLDPEIGGSDGAFGIDNGNYPCARQILFGLELGI